MPRRDEDVAQAEICESRGDGTRHWRDGCLTHDKGVWPGNVPVVKSVRLRKRVERDERAVSELIFEELGVVANWFPSSSWRLVLVYLSNATNSGRETLFAFSRNVWLRWVLITASERPVVLPLEVLAALVDVQL